MASSCLRLGLKRYQVCGPTSRYHKEDAVYKLALFLEYRTYRIAISDSGTEYNNHLGMIMRIKCPLG
jgi:hypothetical protein